MAKKNKKKFVAWKPSKHVGKVIIDDIEEPTNNAKAKKIEQYYNSMRRFPDLSQDRESWLEAPKTSQTFASSKRNGQQSLSVPQADTLSVSVTCENNSAECLEIDLVARVHQKLQKDSQSVRLELRSGGLSRCELNLHYS